MIIFPGLLSSMQKTAWEMHSRPVQLLALETDLVPPKKTFVHGIKGLRLSMS